MCKEPTKIAYVTGEPKKFNQNSLNIFLSFSYLRLKLR